MRIKRKIWKTWKSFLIIHTEIVRFPTPKRKVLPNQNRVFRFFHTAYCYDC